MKAWAPTIVAALAMAGTLMNALIAYNSYSLNRENLKSGMFSQFQQQYNAIAARFPPQLLAEGFRPSRGTDEFRRLEDYWLFCFAEWYATHRTGGGAYLDLWDGYYAGLIESALRIDSLNHVIRQMMAGYGQDRPEMREFYMEIRRIARAGDGDLLAERQ